MAVEANLEIGYSKSSDFVVGYGDESEADEGVNPAAMEELVEEVVVEEPDSEAIMEESTEVEESSVEESTVADTFQEQMSQDRLLQRPGGKLNPQWMNPWR